MPLLERASRRNWSPETRLLYELQKVALDQEREVYELNVWVVVEVDGQAAAESAAAVSP